MLSLFSLVGLVASASVLSELHRLALDSRNCRKHRTVRSVMLVVSVGEARAGEPVQLLCSEPADDGDSL